MTSWWRESRAQAASRSWTTVWEKPGSSRLPVIFRANNVFPILTGQKTPSFFHKTDYIVFVKMIGKGLDKILKTEGLQAQLLIVNHRLDLFFHVCHLLRGIIGARELLVLGKHWCQAGNSGLLLLIISSELPNGLVKYLQNFRMKFRGNCVLVMIIYNRKYVRRHAPMALLRTPDRKADNNL